MRHFALRDSGRVTLIPGATTLEEAAGTQPTNVARILNEEDLRTMVASANTQLAEPPGGAVADARPTEPTHPPSDGACAEQALVVYRLDRYNGVLNLDGEQVREAQRAIRAAQAASADLILIEQRDSILDDTLLEASEREGEVGRAAAAFVAARRHLNGVLRQRYAEAADRAAALANAIVSQALDQRVPDVIRLPREGDHNRVTLVVTAVEDLSLDGNGRLWGTLKTESADRCCIETRTLGHAGGRMCIFT
ncbi:MAG: hypothetical protein L6Q68_08980 [Aquabacterium sp.]|nr:hypothetical protein [Aquabacterium sp.]